MSVYKDALKRQIEQRLMFFEENCNFSHDTKFSDISNKSDGIKMAFGAYDELQTLYTKLFNHIYLTKTPQL